MNIELKNALETLLKWDAKSQNLYLYEENLNTKHQVLWHLHILIHTIPCSKRTKGAIFHLGLRQELLQIYWLAVRTMLYQADRYLLNVNQNGELITRLWLAAYKILGVAVNKRFCVQGEHTGQQKQALNLTLYFLSYKKITRNEIKTIFIIHPSPWQLAITMTLWDGLDFKGYNCAGSRIAVLPGSSLESAQFQAGWNSEQLGLMKGVPWEVGWN